MSNDHCEHRWLFQTNWVQVKWDWVWRPNSLTEHCPTYSIHCAGIIFSIFSVAKQNPTPLNVARRPINLMSALHSMFKPLQFVCIWLCVICSHSNRKWRIPFLGWWISIFRASNFIRIVARIHAKCADVVRLATVRGWHGCQNLDSKSSHLTIVR